MSIRVKFLLALLVAVLLPVSFVALMGLYSTLRLGRTIADNQRAALQTEAEGVMRTIMRKNALSMEQIGGSFVTANLVQIAEVERLLAQDTPTQAPLFTASDFRDGGGVPGLVRSENHLVIAEESDTASEPALVSYAAMVIATAPDSSPEAKEDARRLAAMSESFRALAPSLERTAFWQFITLDSGVHVVYPGNGLLPDDYDGRTSPIYQQSRPNIHLGAGSPPSIDPATGQRLVGSILPIHNAKGDIIGISGVTSRLGAVLEGFRFGTDWGEDAETMFVFTMPQQEGPDSIYIIIRDAYTDNKENSAGFLGIDTFEADDPQHTAQIAEGISRGEFGHLTIEIDGIPMLCCYGSMNNDGTGLITLVPLASVSNIADQAAERIHAQAVNLLIGMIVSAVVFSLSIMFAAVLGVRVITRPIEALITSVRRVASGDLDVHAEVQSKDEIGELANAFNAMVPQLRDNIRIRHSLDLAQQVQRGLLPAAPPTVPGFDLAARSVYCDETGGDYFDFIEFDQPATGSLAIAVGDVTGHGVAAALLMATARALIRMRTTLPGELAEHFGDINRHLAADTDDGRFMTLMFLVLDRAQGSARWVGAGHDPVLVYDPETDDFTELVGRDLPLGIEPAWAFTEQSTDTLRTGQILFIGTDGIWETLDENNNFYGKDRLRDRLRQYATEPAASIADAVVRDIEQFRRDRPQLDDVTMVVVKVTEMP